MNRIITDNYKNKLNAIIDEYDIKPYLYDFIDFLLEEVKKDQIRKCNRNQKVFSKNHIYKLEGIKKSDELKRIFVYLNILIKKFNGKYLHIHINSDLNQSITDNLASLFAWQILIEAIYDKDILNSKIEDLKKETRSDLVLSTENNGHKINQVFRNRNGLKHRLKLFEKIKIVNNQNSNIGYLLNLNQSDFYCINLSEFSIFPEPIDSFVNFGLTLQSIYDNNNFILQNISMIISLLPAERGNNIWYSDFLSENINEWNKLPGFKFKKVITITSGKKTYEALLEMQVQKKFQAEEIYTIHSFEL